LKYIWPTMHYIYIYILARPLIYKEIQPRFPNDHNLDQVAAIVSAKGPRPKSAEVGGGGNY